MRRAQPEVDHSDGRAKGTLMEFSKRAAYLKVHPFGGGPRGRLAWRGQFLGPGPEIVRAKWLSGLH